jgi:antitoxin HicB
MTNKHIGSSLDSFLEEFELLVEVESLALKRIISFELKSALKESQMTKAEAARRMHTSRIAFDRILDPANTSVTLKSLEKAAIALGKRIYLEIK